MQYPSFLASVVYAAEVRANISFSVVFFKLPSMAYLVVGGSTRNKQERQVQPVHRRFEHRRRENDVRDRNDLNDTHLAQVNDELRKLEKAENDTNGIGRKHEKEEVSGQDAKEG
jgi:hypothetical protein